MSDLKNPIVRQLGLVDYQAAWQNMRNFTESRTADTADEIWLLQHPPVFTLGRAGKPEHLLQPGNIPVVLSDRGGQVTYHGPGQLVVYLLLDIRRRHLAVRSLVDLLESSVISLLHEFEITAMARPDAPGVYVDGAKIAALGLRIRQGCSFHGLSLNIDMDLEPFTRINPCGYPALVVTQMRDLVDPALSLDINDIGQRMAGWLVNKLKLGSA